MVNKMIQWTKINGFYLKALLIIYSMIVLQHTDSYYAIYIILGFLSFIELFILRKEKSRLQIDRNHIIQDLISLKGMALFFALCISLSNYRLMGSTHFNPVKFLFVTWGCYYITGYFLLLIKDKFDDYHWNLTAFGLWSPFKTFGVSFCAVIFVNTIFLYLGSYPGILTPDSVDQVHQVVTGIYRNHHPFWHTQLIRVMISLGELFYPNDLYAGIATFSLFQIMLMAGIFSFMLMTLNQACIENKVVKIILAWILLMPFNIFYSVTMWKNILFSGMILLFATVLFRLIHQIGDRKINYTLLFISGLLMSIWQSNGIIAFALTMVLLTIVLKDERKVFTAIGISAFVIAVFMIGPMLHILGVKPTEPNELLSIPQQQMARVLHDKKKISENDLKTLAKYASPDKMKNDYKPYISDPTKGLIRGDYWLEHKADYFKTWAHIGIQYPHEYVKAWIDETRGYWNGGYKYWIWSRGIHNNFYTTMDAAYTYKNNPLQKVFYKYGQIFEHNMLVVFLSIGLHVWILILAAAYSYRKGRKDYLCAVPALSVILTLLISTPVFSEFRYAYSVILTVPLMITAAFYKSDKRERHWTTSKDD